MNRMHRLLAFSLGIAVTASAHGSQPSVEGQESIEGRGHDFWLVTIAQESNSSFESIGHFQHCYFGSRDLGQCDDIFPSPDGSRAIYQDGPSGWVMLFDTVTGNTRKITDSFVGGLRSAGWSGSKSEVELKFSDSNGGSKKSIKVDLGSLQER